MFQDKVGIWSQSERITDNFNLLFCNRPQKLTNHIQLGLMRVLSKTDGKASLIINPSFTTIAHGWMVVSEESYHTEKYFFLVIPYKLDHCSFNLKVVIPIKLGQIKET